MLCSNEEKSWKTGSKAGHPDAMGFINSEWTRMDGLQQLVLSGRPLSTSQTLSLGWLRIDQHGYSQEDSIRSINPVLMMVRCKVAFW
jgi:hypothetical protein